LRRDGDRIGFHDLQHDYLLLHAPALPLLHARLLDAYRHLLPEGHPDEWWRLPPDEPYIEDHLVAHFAGSGERRTLATTVTDPAYLCRRIAARGGVHAAEGDLARSAAALPGHSVIDWWRSWLPRHAHYLDDPDLAHSPFDGTALAPTLLAWLRVTGDRPADVDLARLAVYLGYDHLQARWGLKPPESALVRVLTGHVGSVHSVVWVADDRLVSAGADGNGAAVESGHRVGRLVARRYAPGIGERRRNHSSVAPVAHRQLRRSGSTVSRGYMDALFS
jgi:hypothetical protein